LLNCLQCRGDADPLYLSTNEPNAFIHKTRDIFLRYAALGKRRLELSTPLRKLFVHRADGRDGLRRCKPLGHLPRVRNFLGAILQDPVDGRLQLPFRAGWCLR
jgi:hypothetical protein